MMKSNWELGVMESWCDGELLGAGCDGERSLMKSYWELGVMESCWELGEMETWCDEELLGAGCDGELLGAERDGELV